MNLSKIKNEVVLSIIRNELEESLLLKDFVITKQNLEYIKSPTVITYYNTFLESKLFDRWLFIRVEDYFKYQKVVIWINQLQVPRPTNIDLESYFFSELKIYNVKQKFIFKANTEKEFRSYFRKVLSFASEKIDENIKSVLSGKLWVDMPFDWHSYK